MMVVVMATTPLAVSTAASCQRSVEESIVEFKLTSMEKQLSKHGIIGDAGLHTLC